MADCKRRMATRRDGGTEAHEITMEWRRRATMTSPDAFRARMGRGVQRPVPVEIFCRHAGRFETVLAVNYAAAQELVQKINAEKGTGRHARIGKVGEPLRTANRGGDAVDVHHARHRTAPRGHSSGMNGPAGPGDDE
jgi:hypothetical protein